MFLLAAENGGKIVAVIILSIAAFVFLIVNGFLVISLHKHNTRLAKMGETDLKALPAPEQLTEIKALPAPDKNGAEPETDKALTENSEAEKE